MAKGQYIQPIPFEKAKRLVINYYMDRLVDSGEKGEEKVLAKIKLVKRAKDLSHLIHAVPPELLLKILIK